jgi:hypothetical protein
MAKHKSAPFERAAGVPGNHACAPLRNDADYKSCVTEAGQWFICYRTACHLAQPGLFPPPGASPSVSLFYNCPGAQCRTGASGPLASGQRLNDAAAALIQRCNAEGHAAAQAAGPAG